MAIEAEIAPLISASAIAARVERVAEEVAQTVTSDWIVIALMDGALVFAADLLRALHDKGVNPVFENMTLSSYGDDIQSAGEVRVEKGLTRDLTGRSVLILDDVFETGLTLSVAVNMARAGGAVAVKTCVFAYKDGYAADGAKPDYKGWDAPDSFLVGYGMDFQGRYRGLDYIGDLIP